jgi:cobalt/nickel transport system permease protein
MHIEPGVLNATKVLSANVGAVATLAAYAPGLVRRPIEIGKVLLAAAFFSVFMEIFHLPVGASELHFVGASAVYFTFGFLPTLFGFAIGLLLQGLIFEPQDLVHLGVNSLSLIVPLIATHELIGKRFFQADNKTPVKWSTIVRFDAAYYSGVVGMVGFWLALGNEPTPFYNWLIFAASYLPLVFCEPLFTWGVVRLLNRVDAKSVVRRLTAIDQLKIA